MRMPAPLIISSIVLAALIPCVEPSEADLPANGNLCAVQLLGHLKIESTVQYVGIEIDDAIEIARKSTSEVARQSCRALPGTETVKTGQDRKETATFALQEA